MIIRADARHIPLQDGCVQCVVTSPPYWGLRDYGSAGQIGVEETPDAYVASLVAVFDEVRRVLADDGTVWLNLGDSYSSGGRDTFGTWAAGSKQATHTAIKDAKRAPQPPGLKPKDLVGIPWRVAFALQEGGWYLRSDIIWHKPNPMPESVTDRPTTSHEHIFLLTKSERYAYDAAAIAEPSSYNEVSVARRNRADFGTVGTRAMQGSPFGQSGKGMNAEHKGDTRNKRTVWTVPTMPYAGAHFATMPEKLVEPCILAGCPLGGLVFDPFLGSGTVGAVAERLGRRWVGTDLSYQPLAQKRTEQRGLRW